MSEPTFLLREVIEFLHDRAISEHGGLTGIRDAGLVESLTNRAPNKYYYGGDLDLYDLAAAYAFGFGGSQAFMDGNKRAGWAACAFFLEDNGITIYASVPDRIQHMLALAKGDVSEQGFAAWLRHCAEGT